MTVRNSPQEAMPSPGSTPRGYAAAGVYEVSARTRAITLSLERDYRLREVSAWPIASLRVNCIVARLPPLTSRTALIARLTHDSRVESVQPLNEFTAETDVRGTAKSPRRPTPPRQRPYLPLQVNLSELGVLQAHRLSQGAAVRIAIIDTGIDYRHPDLQHRVIAHQDFVAGEGDEFTADRHGTEVAGVIAATAHGGRGVLGIAPRSHIIALKACWPLRRGGAAATCNSFTLAQALQAAITARVNIVNMSLAGPPDPLLARLIRYGVRQGIIYVGAVAPGHGAIPDTFPVDVPGVLGVQSAEDAARHSPHLLAPGHGILTLVPGGHYDFASGSSLATAEVTGIVALLLADGRRLPGATVERILARTSRKLITPTGVLTSVNACAAVADALERSSCPSAGEAAGRPMPPPATRSEEAVQLDEQEARSLGGDRARTVVVAHTGS